MQVCVRLITFLMSSLAGGVITAPGRHRARVHPESRREHWAPLPPDETRVQAQPLQEEEVEPENQEYGDARPSSPEVQFITPRLRRLAANARESRERLNARRVAQRDGIASSSTSEHDASASNLDLLSAPFEALRINLHREGEPSSNDRGRSEPEPYANTRAQ